MVNMLLLVVYGKDYGIGYYEYILYNAKYNCDIVGVKLGLIYDDYEDIKNIVEKLEDMCCALDLEMYSSVTLDSSRKDKYEHKIADIDKNNGRILFTKSLHKVKKM